MWVGFFLQMSTTCYCTTNAQVAKTDKRKKKPQTYKREKQFYILPNLYSTLFFFRGIRAKWTWAKQSLNPHEYLKELWGKGNGKAAICWKML